MSYILQPGTSFCRIGERLLFLNVPADRYFCLSPRAETAFAKVVDRYALTIEEQAAVRDLCRQQLLVETADDRTPAPCAALPEPQSSVLSERAGPAAKRHSLAALVGVIKSRATLRFGTLETTLQSIARSKRRRAVGLRSDDVTLAALASAYQRTELMISPVGQCLPRSIAIARALLDRGIAVDLVLGVKLNPFEAHCWVQSGDRLINDWPDHVRGYTPILVI